ncbi:MAG: hypothetical protein JWM85_655 [Acidimicrobiaceae bacterium]|nr:hypothetical protein [Acidimicrobiaceae bacterium]
MPSDILDQVVTRPLVRSPGGASQRAVNPPWVNLRRRRRIRLAAATVLATCGAADLQSVFALPRRGHLRLLLDFLPLVVPQTAGAVVALAGLGLLGLSYGVRRGQRQAWTIAVVLLPVTAILRLLRDLDAVGAFVALAAFAFLAANRRSFSAPGDALSRRVAGLWLVLATFGATVGGTCSIELSYVLHDRRDVPAFGRVLSAVAERLVGETAVPLPSRVAEFATPALLAIGIAVAVVAVALLTRPAVDRRRGNVKASLGQAREIVASHCAGSLDYFALRSDKRHFFYGDSVVTYGRYGRVCLVSPDPIGPVHEREACWHAFLAFADEHAWVVSVLGARKDWLAVYRSARMRTLYVGDEAVIDVASFELSGGRRKSLRQAVNRVGRHGYSVSFHDPCEVDPKLARALHEIRGSARTGKRERGFSMTLGRLFDREDTGLLLAVAHAPDGRPVAFCQFVPGASGGTADAGGMSLDLMRGERGEHPNGLVDFVVVATIEELRARKVSTVALNFATMRAVLADDGDKGPVRWLQRQLLRRLSRVFQIESLWRFNAKYDPEWHPRYLAYECAADLPAVGLAITRAESLWELPRTRLTELVVAERA